MVPQEDGERGEGAQTEVPEPFGVKTPSLCCPITESEINALQAQRQISLMCPIKNQQSRSLMELRNKAAVVVSQEKAGIWVVGLW